MKTRRLPRREVEFSELGFGAAPIGNLGRPVSEEDARAALQLCWDGGVRYVDTAPHYGLGLSERRVGSAIARWPRHDVILSTKVGRLLEPLPGPPTTKDDQGFDVPKTHRRVWDFSRDGVRRSLDASLERLGLDRIDIVLLHDPDDHWDQASRQAIPALAEFRDQGVIRAIGVGMNQTKLPTRFVRETDIDVVMLAGRYTLLDHALALETLMPAALDEGVGIIAAGVFNSGLLAGARPDSGATYDYAPAAPEMLARAERIADICRDHGTTAAAAALHFVLAHPAVTTAVLGMRNAEQARGNLAVYRAPPGAALWDELRRQGVLPDSAPTPG
jgi:D-threo-aldose 1-dehydrogenase